MMSSLSISSSERKVLGALFVALVAFFALDGWLYAGKGFLRYLGDNTVEGQVLSKIDRAPRFAKVADIILFGASYIREGVASEPFLRQNIMPFNFANAGAGNLQQYYALKSIADVLKKRKVKPVLVVSIKDSMMLRTDKLPRGQVIDLWAGWNEYRHIHAMVRSRIDVLRDWPLLYRHFSDYGLRDRFINGFVAPSSFYKKFTPLLLSWGTMFGYHWGMEDCCGFAARHTVHPNKLPTYNLPAYDVKDFQFTKVAYLRKFLALARETGTPVVIIPSPNPVGNGLDTAYTKLIANLKIDFPDIRFVGFKQYGAGMKQEDFDSSDHINIWGSDKIATNLIDILKLKGEPESFQKKWRYLFDTIELPPTNQWKRMHKAAKASDLWPDGLAFEFESKNYYVFARSPSFDVVPGADYIIEWEARVGKGRAAVSLLYEDPETGKTGSAGTNTSFEGRTARMFLRHKPKYSRAYLALIGLPPINSEKDGIDYSVDIRVLRMSRNWPSEGGPPLDN